MTRLDARPRNPLTFIPKLVLDLLMLRARLKRDGLDQDARVREAIAPHLGEIRRQIRAAARAIDRLPRRGRVVVELDPAARKARRG